MSEIITEKEYPIQEWWILKKFLNSFLFLAIVGSLFWYFDEPVYLWIVILFTIWNFFVSILSKENFHYSIEEQFVTVRSGILSKQERHVPYGVIQGLYVKQDLLDKFFGLASLTIENASHGGADLTATEVLRGGNSEFPESDGGVVHIPGLTKANAEILKGIILQRRKENPIEDSQSGL